jgi:hypothetical protein
MDMNFGTWNVRSLNWSEAFKTLDRELRMYRLCLLGVWEFVSGKGVTEQPQNYMYLFVETNWKENQFGTGLLVYQRVQ